MANRLKGIMKDAGACVSALDVCVSGMWVMMGMRDQWEADRRAWMANRLKGIMKGAGDVGVWVSVGGWFTTGQGRWEADSWAWVAKAREGHRKGRRCACISAVGWSGAMEPRARGSRGSGGGKAEGAAGAAMMCVGGPRV